MLLLFNLKTFNQMAKVSTSHYHFSKNNSQSFNTFPSRNVSALQHALSLSPLSLPSLTTERERKLLWCQPVFIVTTPSWPILQVPLKLPQVIQEQHNHIEDEPTRGVAAPSASSSTTTTEPEWRETDTPIIKPWLHLFFHRTWWWRGRSWIWFALRSLCLVCAAGYVHRSSGWNFGAANSLVKLWTA